MNFMTIRLGTGRWFVILSADNMGGNEQNRSLRNDSDSDSDSDGNDVMVT
jgi:hypothetical protein